MTTENAIAPSETGVVHYRLVPEQSKFTVQAFAEGLFSAFSHDPILDIKDFTGESQFVPGSFESASVKITIQADSIVLSNEVKEKDRLEIEQTMREQVHEIAKYPELMFVSSNISVTRLAEGRYRARVIGDLTFHGATQKNLWITSEVTVNGESLKATGEFSPKQTDFGIKPFSRLLAARLNSKMSSKFSFDIVAHKIG